MFKINYSYLFFFTALFLNTSNVLRGSFDQQSNIATVQSDNQSREMLKLIDQELGKYYQSHGDSTYYNGNDGRGKFLIFCEENGYEDDNMEDEFGENSSLKECVLIDFDKNFPVPTWLHKDAKQEFMFGALQYFYNIAAKNSANNNRNKGLALYINALSEKKKKKKCTKTSVCPISECNKKFASGSERNAHLEIHKTCKECGKKFECISSLEKHLREHKYKYKCHTCGKRFQTRRRLCYHTKEKHSFSIKTYECELCNKRFRTSTDLKLHMRSHRRGKKYKCPHRGCEKIFCTRMGLNYHNEQVHHDRRKKE